MIEYKILVPTYNNKGVSTLAARIKFQKFLLEGCGGFACGCEVYGEWRSNDGTVYQDHSIPVYIALDPAFDFGFIVRQWFALFADQEACYWTRGAEAHIETRVAPATVVASHDKGYRK